MKTDVNGVIERLRALNAAFAPGSPKIKEMLTRAGVLLQGEIKLNIRRQGLIDTSRLINSIFYFVEQSDQKAILRVGSFGVPYAPVHEFGYDGIQRVRAATRTSPNGTSYDVRAHDRRMNIPARPYLRPAVEKHRARIVDFLREAAQNGGSQ